MQDYQMDVKIIFVRFYDAYVSWQFKNVSAEWRGALRDW